MKIIDLLFYLTMTTLYKNKYRIESTRLKNWNYANEAAYFVTICTKNREHYFGEIIEGKLHPSEIGGIALSEWFRAIELRPDMNLKLGEFVVMPNHIHGIIMIGGNEYNTGTVPTIPTVPTVETQCIASQQPFEPLGNQFGPQSKNLSSIIRGYKSAVTTYARKNGIEFGWQPLFHEHIIRSEDAFNRISDYIIQNPNPDM